MRRVTGTLLGKTISKATRLRNARGGHALPGLVVGKVVPGYIKAMLQQLPDGIVIITGTNGKTTTTKMVVELLEANGKRVLTNPTGSNMMRGIASTLTHQAKPSGKLAFDIAVFEMDEAYASQLGKEIAPRWVLALNVSRDQLDRFGEVDTIARYITAAMAQATDGVITNADDDRLRTFAQTKLADGHQKVLYFGINPKLLKFFPRDNELVNVEADATLQEPSPQFTSQVELVDFKDSQASYNIDGKTYPVTLQVTGQHNFQNAAAAVTLVHAILPTVTPEKITQQLSEIRTAFGRGQAFQLPDGSSLQLALVKNPAGFRQNLASYVDADTTVMVAINDNIADSRDLSWLWDVDFSSLKQSQGVALTSGRRAVDMALRLSYDEIPVTNIEPDLHKALSVFSKLPDKKKVILASYTAMMRLHKLLEGMEKRS